MTDILIIASSILLFGYWFRYTCLLILTAKTARDYAGDVATANGLSFPEVQVLLREESPAGLDRLRDSLDRDFVLINYLLKHAGSARGEATLERMMLAVHYHSMHAFYGISKRISTDGARRAIEDMSLVVAHFANMMGEQAAAA
jgi:hypothetical protein